MRDLAEKWPVVPDWSTVSLEKGGLAARTLTGLSQLLVSGNLAAWARISKMPDGSVGASAIASGDRYMVRIARDRILAVAERPFPVAAGWHGEGVAVSALDAGMHVLEVSGSGVPKMLARATTLDPDHAGPSASILFAGINVLLYRYGDAQRVRIHVDRGLAPYLWEWLDQSTSL